MLLAPGEFSHGFVVLRLSVIEDRAVDVELRIDRGDLTRLVEHCTERISERRDQAHISGVELRRRHLHRPVVAEQHDLDATGLPGPPEQRQQDDDQSDQARRDEGREESVVRSYPMKRLGLPEDIAGAVSFLLSTEASWITGQTLTIDGGVTLGGAF